MSTARSGPLVGLLVITVVVTLVAPTGAVESDASGNAAAQVDPDSVLLRASLQSDGTADWTVEYRIRLDDENATAAFESLREDIRANRSEFEAQFADRMRPTVEAGENATGRAMAITDVSVTTSRQTLGQEYGVVTYSFVWTGFARVNGSRLAAGDALAGLFLDSETSLTIEWPATYHVVRVRPSPSETDNRSVTWAGRLNFAADEPVLVVAAGPAPSPTTEGTGPVDGGGDGGVSTAMLAVAGLVIVTALGAAGWLVARRRGQPSGAAAESESVASTPTDLLSNEERVLQLLSDHGGRMKQQRVADELEWTDAKTSQVVSNLREDDEINSFRLGRENVLTLPDHDLTGSTEDDE